MKQLLAVISVLVIGLTLSTSLVFAQTNHGFNSIGQNLNPNNSFNNINQPFGTNQNGGSINQPLTTNTAPQNNSIDSVQDALGSIGIFINYALLPLLFGIALLIFLVNAVRYFIIGGGNEESQAKARQLATWGILGFVFLVSLWGIVNLFVVGFRFTNDDQSLCPDYLQGWCGDSGGSSGFSSIFRRQPLADTRQPTDSGREPGADTRTPGGGVQPNGSYVSGIAELMFGNLTDIPSLNYSAGAPRSALGTINIETDEQCIVAMSTFQLGSKVENTQASYLLYTDALGSRRWENVTDLTFENGVAHDSDIINSLKANGVRDVYLIHSHQKGLTEDAGLQSNGFPPSTNDMKLTCDPLLQDVTQVVVDWENIWVLEQNQSVCPRRSDQEQQFTIIEAFLWLSQVQLGDRAQEFTDLVNAPNIPDTIRNILSPYLDYSLDSMSAQEVYDLSSTHQDQAGIRVYRFGSPTNFCASL